MAKKRRRPSTPPITPRPLNDSENIRGIIRDELSKALQLPPGTQTTSMSAGYLQQLAMSGNVRASATSVLSRDPLDNAPFGPGVPLIPAPFDPSLASGRPAPRRYEYPVTTNLQLAQPGVPWSVLRDAADSVSVMRACIEVVKSTITGLEWSFGIDTARARHLARRTGDSPHTVSSDLAGKYADDIDRLHTFWLKPDRINNWNFSEWLGALLEDQLVLDAVAAYPHLTLGGELHSLELIDSSTIKPLLDYRGATPQPPHPAFQQILYGFPRGEYSQSLPQHVAREFVSAVYGPMAGNEAKTDALIYKVRNRRTRSPYGFSNVEQALTDVDLWLRRYDWLRSEYQAGVTPEMIIQVDANMTPEQLRQYEAVFNDDLSGQTAERHRARFLPAGFNPTYPSSVDSKFSSDFDLHIIKLICAAFDVLPTSLGFSPIHGMGGMGSQGHMAQEQDCYSNNVEVLTRAGWKRFEDVDISVDEFATRNPKDQSFEWQEAVHKTVADFDGEMIRFYNGRSLDLTVSPNHRMLLRNKGRSKNEFILRADEAAKRPCLVPMCSTWDVPDHTEPIVFPSTGRTNSKSLTCSADDFAAFMGMYLAEGCCLPYGVQISQREKSKGFVEFQALVERITGFVPAHNGGRNLRIHSATLRDYCAQFGKATDKYMPDLVKNMSKRQLEIFFHFYWLGDGWATLNGGREFATASKRLADDLQEVAQKIGYSSGIRKVAGRTERHAAMYFMTMRKSRYATYLTERVPYTGKIYCVTVPNEILYVRQNGKPAWCGNTQLYRATKPTAQWVVDLINEVCSNYLGMPDEVTFQFHGLDAADEQKEATLLTGYISAGLETLNEGRDQLNLPRYTFAEADEPMLVTPTGPTFLNSDVAPVAMPGNLPSAAQNQPGYRAQAPAPAKPQAGDRDEQTTRASAKKAERNEFMAFARNRAGQATWRDFAFKQHQPEIGDAANRLAAAGDVDAVKALFEMAGA